MTATAPLPRLHTPACSPTTGNAKSLPLGHALRPRRSAMGFVSQTAITGIPSPAHEAAGWIADETGEHTLVIAPTGAGKGRSLLIPWLLHSPASVVVVDPKGEAAAVTADARRAMGQQVHVLDLDGLMARLTPGLLPAGASVINPLRVQFEGADDLSDAAMTLAELIVGPRPQSMQDPFWFHTAQDLICALLGYVWLRGKFEGQAGGAEGTLGDVYKLLTADDIAYQLAVVLDTHGRREDFPAWLHRGLASFLAHEGDKVRPSVRSEAASLMRIFGSDAVMAATSRHTVPTEALINGEPVSLYLVLPPDKLESHAAYVRIVLGTLLGALSRRRRRPALNTLFLVDEMAHIGAIPALKQAVTLLRGYGVSVAMFLQSLGQLKALWPNDWETVINNCRTVASFGLNNLAAATQLADHLGDISASALYGMADDELAIHQGRAPTRIARRLDYLTDPQFQGLYAPNPYHLPPPPVPAVPPVPPAASTPPTLPSTPKGRPR